MQKIISACWANCGVRLRAACGSTGTSNERSASCASAVNGSPTLAETPALAQQAERIFCMTSAHRAAVIKMLPGVASKTFCLDAQADIADPIGKGMEAYLNCAQRIHDLVRLRFDELNLKAA